MKKDLLVTFAIYCGYDNSYTNERKIAVKLNEDNLTRWIIDMAEKLYPQFKLYRLDTTFSRIKSYQIETDSIYDKIDIKVEEIEICEY